MLSKQERVDVFRNLFKGREDVFAKRWQKYDGSLSGYSPIYADWKKKEHQKLTQAFIEKHLLGKITIGLYPLLENNSSYFIAADFDGEKWLSEAKKFLKECKVRKLPVYLERSRSGKGGHVWCFFKETYPAYKSRAIFFSLLQKVGVIDEYSKSEIFDRLFPNQDYHSGKGFGNLIALPLQGISRKEGNTIFLDPNKKFEPAEDQWDFILNIKKVSKDNLDSLFEKVSSTSPKTRKTRKTLILTVKNVISIPKSQIPPNLATYLRDELNFLNIERIAKEKMGFSTHDTQKYFQTITSDEKAVHVPRGFLPNLGRYLEENGISYDIDDRRSKTDFVKFSPSFSLFLHQEKVLRQVKGIESGVIVSPPGSGKTVMGLAIIAEKKQPSLILTHRRQIYSQWLSSVESFLGIPKKEIGQFGSVKKEIKSPITVAMVQSLKSAGDWKTLPEQFGLVLVDECHHLPASTFRDTVSWLNPYYLYGVTATPKRKHGDEKLIYAYLGDVIAHVEREEVKRSADKQPPKVELVVRETNFSMPFKPKTSDFHMVIKLLIADVRRNSLIAEDVVREVRENKARCLILTERKEHVDILEYFLKRDVEVVSITGNLSNIERKRREKLVKDGDFQVLIATGQILGEGTDLPHVDSLFLVFPFSFEGKLIQYIGRIERGESATKRVYDFRDGEIPLLEKLFKKRKTHYNKRFKD